MNAHQRRKHARRVHMELPTGAEVRIPRLHDDIKRTVWRHCIRWSIGLGYGHRPNVVQMKLAWPDGRTAHQTIPLHCVRLVNPADRAARPWWTERGSIKLKHP